MSVNSGATTQRGATFYKEIQKKEDALEALTAEQK